MPQYDVDLRDYWRIIKKRKMTVLLIALFVGISSFGFAKMREPLPLYKANSAIKITETTTLADVFTGAYWGGGETLQTHAYLINSFSVMELAAKNAGLIPEGLGRDEIRTSEKYMGIVQQLKDGIETELEVGTNVINIRVTSRDPQEAAGLANAAATAYRTYNILEKNKKTFETKSFIEEQLRQRAEELEEAEARLRRFEEERSILQVDAQPWARRTAVADDHLGSVFNKWSEKYETLSREKSNITSLIRLLENAAGDPVHSIKEASLAAYMDSKAYELTQPLRDLVRQRRLLLVDLTEKHPAVLDLDDQIHAARATVIKDLSSYADSIASRMTDISKKMEDLKKANLDFPGEELELQRLRRNVQLQETLFSELKSKYQEILIQEAGKVEEVSIVRPALVPGRPFNIPSKGRIVFTGIVLGIILGLVAAFGIEVFDTSIGTIEDVEALLQVPVVGVIPHLEAPDNGGDGERGLLSTNGRGRNLVTHFDPKSLASEAFRYLRTNIQFISVDRKTKSLLMTSSFIQEGKTFNVINLALSMAQSGNKVLLVEADLRKPVIHKNFGLSKSPGMTDYVLGNYHWTEIRNGITDVMLGDFELEDILRTPGLDNLNIITAGTTPPNPSEILRSERFRAFLKEAHEQYDIVLLDAPPVLPVADATEIAPLVDGVVLIYTVGKIGRGILKRAKLSLENVQSNVLGVVLNNVKPDVGPDYFKYHSKYYYGPDRGDGGKKAGKLRKSGRGAAGAGNYLQWLVLIAALAAVTIGIFWQEALRLLAGFKF